jgi:methenyltetrahydrofolate cyclohydrolase
MKSWSSPRAMLPVEHQRNGSTSGAVRSERAARTSDWVSGAGQIAVGSYAAPMNTGELSLDSWLEKLADHTPTPGGGAVAAFLAAVSAALLGMVANYTTGPKWADYEPRMKELAAELGELRGRAITLADRDAQAFASVATAYKLPRSTPEEKAQRSAAIQAALVIAAGPPEQVGELAARLVTVAAELAEHGNPNVVSDVAVASSTARAALESALVNIDVNRRQIRDEAERGRLDGVVTGLKQAVTQADSITAAAQERMG